MRKHRLEIVPSGRLGEYYTMKLVEPFLDSGRNVTVDSWFTFMSLAAELYKRGTTLVGTLRRKGYVPAAYGRHEDCTPLEHKNLTIQI